MRTCSIAPNCTIPQSEVIDFDADPDASGIGVIAAFYTAAWLTTVILTLTYLISDPKTFNNYGFCYLDQLLVGSIQGTARSYNFKTSPFFASRIRKALQRSIMILSDQQLIGGAAIGIVALSRHCEITQYHFNIAINLILVASLAHSMTFSFVGQYIHQVTFFRSWRAVAMLLLGTLCFGTWVVTGNVHWLEVYGMPTQCAYDNLGDGFKRPAVDSLILLYWFLLRGYFFALTVLFPKSAALEWLSCYISLGYWLAWVCGWLGRLSLKALSQRQMHDSDAAATNQQAPDMDQPIAPARRQSLHLRICHISATVLSVTLQLLHAALYGIAQVWTSYAFSLLWMCYTIGQSPIFIDYFRSTAVENGMQGDENKWGYGQVLSVLLLAAPILAIIETFFDTADGNKASDSDNPLQFKDIEGIESSTSFAIDIQDSGTFELKSLKSMLRESDDDEADLSTLSPSTDDHLAEVQNPRAASETSNADAVIEMNDEKQVKREGFDEEVVQMQQKLWESPAFRVWVLCVAVGLSAMIIEIGL